MTQPELTPKDFQNLVLESLDLFCIAGLDGYFRWVSPAFTRCLGWTPEELCASPFIEFVHPDDVESTLTELKRLEEGQPTIQFENRYRKKDGGYRWFQWNAIPQTSGVLYCNAREVTEQKETERVSERRARFLNMAEELAHFGYWHLDLRKETVSWSDEVFRIHGLPVGEEPTLADAINFYHPDDRETVQRSVNAAITDKKSFSFELRIIRADDTTRHVESRGRPEVNARGEVVGVFGVFMDITDTIEQRRELERKSRKLQQFVHVASHDLQEPLRMVSSYIEILEQGYAHAFDSRGRRFMGYVLEGARRMKTLVDDVLAFSRATSVLPEPRPVELGDLLDAIERDLSLLFEDTGAALKRDRPVPTVQSDPALLRVVLQNLIANAVKFRQEGVAPECRVSARVGDAGFTIEVSDNGIGIRPDHLDRIFDPFERLHDRDRYEGNGIGLAIVRDAVEALGGQIDVRSEVGSGTTFTVRVSR